MVSVTAEATQEIDADVAVVWNEALKLQWLHGWDKVLVLDIPTVGGEFWLVDEKLQIRCNWTRVETHHALEWVGNNGLSGLLRFSSSGRRTEVTYQTVDVPPTASDKLLTGFLKIVARGNLQQQSAESAASELKSLSTRVERRLSGNPVDDNVRRQMIDLCGFGMGCNDSDVVPLFDAAGRLVLEGEEAIIWEGEASSAAAEDAKGARGAEQWRTMWKLEEAVQLTLTTQRMVYVRPKPARADGSLILIGGFTGAALVGLSALRARAQNGSGVLAGQIRHLHLLNLITGGGSRPSFSSPETITATALQLPDRLLRVSLAVASGPEAAHELAALWTKTASADRLQRFAHLAESQAEGWSTLREQFEAPSPRRHYHGELWQIPLGCAITRSKPYRLPPQPTAQ